MTLPTENRIQVVFVSTHMPLARHDNQLMLLPLASPGFYSHASCEAWLSYPVYYDLEQSFYSHASCEAWLPPFLTSYIIFVVSTHMPLARHDVISCLLWPGTKFLLTCLLRGMTHLFAICCAKSFVSTHMPLARHDKRRWKKMAVKTLFLLTCLLRGMTRNLGEPGTIPQFLLTCLLRGMTIYSRYVALNLSFLLTCLLRGMTFIFPGNLHFFKFLLTCLLRGMTRMIPLWMTHNQSFYSHASCEAWPFNKDDVTIDYSFYSHASCEAWPG